MSFLKKNEDSNTVFPKTVLESILSKIIFLRTVLECIFLKKNNLMKKVLINPF